jgi:hypothetical protein
VEGHECEWRELPDLDEVEQLVAGHIGPRPVRHGGGELSNELAARAVVMLQAQGSKGARRKG